MSSATSPHPSSFYRHHHHNNHTHPTHKSLLQNHGSNRTGAVLIHRRHFSKIRVFRQPDVGEGTIEVDILEWHVKIGDKVRAFQVIGRGKYEKADVDILSPFDGIVHKIIIPAGDIVRVHEPLIAFEVDEEGDDDEIEVQPETQTTSTPSTAEPAQAQEPQILQSQTITTTISTAPSPTPVNPNGSVLSLPAVKKLAKDNHIDLSLVSGSGRDGRVNKEDLFAYMNAQKQQSTAPQQPQTQTASPSQSKATQLPSTPPLSIQTTDKIEKIIGVPRAMARKMTEANAVPLFGYGDEVILNKLVEMKNDLKVMSAEFGVKITYMPFIIKATSLALLSPQSNRLNAHVNKDCTELLFKGAHNIGVAVDTPQGLIVPNIKNVAAKSILEIAKDLNALVERGNTSTVTADDLSGGTFSLSNIGAIGGTYMNPIVFVPEVCIGTIGSIRKYPRYDENGEQFCAHVMAVSWCADHRVIDGATVARFSNQWKQYLENPSSMLLHLR